MRAYALFGLLVCAGCSVLFEMDAYDRGAGGRPGEPGAAADAAVVRDGAPDEAGGTLAPDASTADQTAACIPETEPNDTAEDADPLPIGSTCGTLATVADLDLFVFDVASPGQLEITYASEIVVNIYKDGFFVRMLGGGGVSVSTIDPGRYGIEIYTGGGTGGYKLVRK